MIPQSEREKIEIWCAKSAELWVDIYVSHSGSSSDCYFVKSANDLEHLIAQTSANENNKLGDSIEVCIFRQTPFTVRGIVNEALFSKAMLEIPDGEHFRIVSPEHFYPSKNVFWASGEGHIELRSELQKLIGKNVAIGRHPFDRDEQWIKKQVYASPNEVLIINYARINGSFVPNLAS